MPRDKGWTYKPARDQPKKVRRDPDPERSERRDSTQGGQAPLKRFVLAHPQRGKADVSKKEAAANG